MEDIWFYIFHKIMIWNLIFLVIFLKVSCFSLNNTMKENKSKEKLEVYVTPIYKEAVRAKADVLGVTMGDVIKRALEAYLGL